MSLRGFPCFYSSRIISEILCIGFPHDEETEAVRLCFSARYLFINQRLINVL